MRRWLITVAVAISGLAPAEVWPIRTYTTADGLAADEINRIFADSRGLLWFLTNEGLSRFDGYQFVNYGSAQGLPHRFVEAMMETRAGDLWIGTERGVSRIAAAAGNARFLNYPVGSPNLDVTAIIETRSGKILAGTTDGLFEGAADPAGDFHFARSELAGTAGLLITDLLEDRVGNVWVAATVGVTIFGPRGPIRSFGPKDGLPGEWVQALLLDSKGEIWAGVRGGLAGIRQNAAGEWAIDRVYRQGTLVGSNVIALHESPDGTLWVGTQFGISRLKWGSDKVPAIQNLTRDQGLSDRAVFSLTEDQAGNIWAGTESAGAMRIDRAGFTTYREQDGLTSDRIFSVFEDRRGNLITVSAGAKTRTRSLDILDGVRFHGASPRRFSDAPSWGLDQVLLESRAGEWWGATDRGLCRYGSGKPEELNGRPPRACYTDDTVFRIFEDSKGGIWSSSQTRPGDRLMRWDPRTNRPVVFPFPHVRGVEIPDLVNAFAEDRQGNIWMGLWVGGLYRYNGERFEFFGQSDGLPGGTVYALFPQGDSLWVGSNGGLTRIENTADRKPHFDNFTTTRGMSSDTVLCITGDAEGRIYAGTGKGVDRLEPATGHIRRFTAANGLAHGTLHSAFRDHNGSLWFATTQGLSKLNADVDRPAARPRILITDLRAGGVVQSISQLGESRISRLELAPSANQLQVEFVGFDYEPGDTLRYSYKLDGAGGDWSAPRVGHTLNFAALSSGQYRFLVKAVNSDGLESVTPAEVAFTVLPPLWRRWWFELIALAAAVLIVYLLHTYRVAQMVGIEKMRTAIATDLHDDIGSSLSQIAVLSEVARAGVDGGNRRTNESLERVAVLSRELVDSMGDIVWSIRAAPDGLDSLVARMREFALDLLAGQGIEFRLRSPGGIGEVHLSLAARRHLFLMFKECLHNISRHSGCTSAAAALEVVDRHVVLTVEDDGRGFDPQNDPGATTGGNGIPGLRRRAEALGGRVEIRSRPGEGSTVSVKVPLRQGRLANYLFE